MPMLRDLFSDRLVLFGLTLLLGTVFYVLFVHPSVAALITQFIALVMFGVPLAVLLYSLVRELFVTGEVKWKSRDLVFDIPYFEKEVEDAGEQEPAEQG
jgi:hypothetical protein